MKPNRPLVQAIAIVVVALVCAVVANGFAGRTRKLMLPGYYPDATRVPPRKAEVVPPPVRTETVAPTPVPAPVPTTTTATAAPTPVPAAPVAEKPTQHSALSTQHSVPPAPTKPSRTFEPHPDKAYIELDGGDVASLHSQGALFLDARRSSVYEQGHIAGARSYSVWESDIDDKIGKLFGERSDPTEQNKPIVVYCSGGDCEDSHMLSQKLWGAQFNNVYVYKDGFPDWQKRGGAIRTGSAP